MLLIKSWLVVIIGIVLLMLVLQQSQRLFKSTITILLVFARLIISFHKVSWYFSLHLSPIAGS